MSSVASSPLDSASTTESAAYTFSLLLMLAPLLPSGAALRAEENGPGVEGSDTVHGDGKLFSSAVATQEHVPLKIFD